MEPVLIDLLIVIDKADYFSTARGDASVSRIGEPLVYFFDVDDRCCGCLALKFADDLFGIVFTIVIND